MANRRVSGETVEDTHEGTQPAPLEGSLSVQEAAVFYGVAEKTIRRRIKAGALRAFQHQIAEGFEWRVIPEGTHRSNGAVQAPQEGTQHAPEAGIQTTHQGTHSLMGEDPPAAPSEAVILQAFETIEHIQHEHTALVEQLRRDNAALVQRNEQLAGQVGFLQARVQEQERQIALLMAPKDEAPAPPSRRLPQAMLRGTHCAGRGGGGSLEGRW